VDAVNAIGFLGTCLDRYRATDADLIHDLRLAGLTEQEAERLPLLLTTIRPRAAELAARAREIHAAHEALPTITGFAAACDLRAVFASLVGTEDVLAAESGRHTDEDSGVLAWVPIAVLTLETRDFAGDARGTSFQAPLPILKNLISALQKVRCRLERMVEESAGPVPPRASMGRRDVT
jgi:hypothetical protein